MSNSLLSLPAVASERFRSLEATPVLGASREFGRIPDR